MNALIDISNVILKTPRITLRAFNENDLEDFYEYASVEGVGEMAGWPHHESIENTKYVLNMFIEEKKTFAIVVNGKVVGSLGIEYYDEQGFKELQDLKGREIGYVLSKAYWGQGLMPEAVNEVLRYLFDDLKLDFVVCGHFLTNNQSKRVQEKMGFKFHHYKKYDTLMGTKVDAVDNLLTKEDYYENRNK